MNLKPCHIIQLTADNVKRLKAVSIKPDGNMVVLGGRNGQGKSSVLEAIAMAVGGGNEALEQPIHEGAEKAQIVLNLGEIVVKRTFTANGGTNLVIENSEGDRKKSPQAILDELTNKLTFDPLAFTLMKSDAQKSALEKLLGLDFSAEDAERARLYAERTINNRAVDQLRAQVASMPKHEGVPTEEQSSAELIAELESAQRHELTIKDLQQTANDANREALAAEEEVSRISREIDDLTRKLESAKASLKKAEATQADRKSKKAAAAEALAAAKPVDIAPIKAKIAELDAVNAKVRANAERAKKIEEGKAAKAKSDDLTAQIDKIDAGKAAKLKATKFPIDKLSVSDSGVVYDGKPFSQASQADQIRVSVAIAAASNPKLRVMLVKNGSLLDNDSMALLGRLAQEHNLQLWVERVGEDQHSSVVIEDGMIKSTKANDS